MTEFWYDLDGPWREARQHIASEASRLVLAQDEARFMDRDSMCVVVVEEHQTAAGDLIALPFDTPILSRFPDAAGSVRAVVRSRSVHP